MLRCPLRRSGPAIVAFAALSTLLVGQEGARWFVRASDAGLQLSGPTSLRGRLTDPVTTPPGDYVVDFPRDALGKPESLAFTVPEAATVAIAVAPARVAEAVTLAMTGDADYLAAATAANSGSAGQLGLVARKTDDDNWYRFVWDREREQFRLERSIGGSTLVIQAAPAPAADERSHELTFQVEGFRLRAYFDDRLVLQALDGAHGRGAWETWQAGGSAVRWEDSRVERPAPARASSALVQSRGSATCTAAAAVAAGHHYVLELALDRPHPLVLLTPSAIELWLLQRPAAPTIAIGDFRGDLGSATIGELPSDGRLQSQLRWPAGKLLSGQCALVRAAVISPDGDRLVSRTPSVAVQF